MAFGRRIGVFRERSTTANRRYDSLPQDRSDFTEEYPLSRKIHRRIFNILSKLPLSSTPASKHRYPNILHRFFWNGVFAWQGRRGMYSHGVAVGGRKPVMV